MSEPTCVWEKDCLARTGMPDLAAAMRCDPKKGDALCSECSGSFVGVTCFDGYCKVGGVQEPEQVPVADDGRPFEYLRGEWWCADHAQGMRARGGYGEALGAGSEPYRFDFGDREYAAWLRKHLTDEELAQRDAAWDRYRALDDRLRWLLPWGWQMRIRRVLTARRRRAVERIDALARERGGEPPGPSWKVRTEWGA